MRTSLKKQGILTLALSAMLLSSSYAQAATIVSNTPVPRSRPATTAPKTPVVSSTPKTTTPAAKTATPVAKATTPAAKATTPAAKATTPAAKATTPASKATTPAAKPTVAAPKQTLVRQDATTRTYVRQSTVAPSKPTLKEQLTQGEATPGKKKTFRERLEDAQRADHDASNLSSYSLLPTKATSNLNLTLRKMIGGGVHQVPGLGVVVIKNGKEVYHNFQGRRFISRRNSKWSQPFTGDTRVRVASISKVFTATGFMQLVEKGKIDLDADISKYLGYTVKNPRYPNNPITSRMLLSHTSSLRDTYNSVVPARYTIRDVLVPGGRLYHNGGNYAPYKQPQGTYYCYANLNYIVLGTIIERVTGERFDRYMKKHVLKPLDIGGSFNPYDFNAAERDRLAEIYRVEGGLYTPQVDERPIGNPSSAYANYKIGTNAGLGNPQGGLRASAHELSHLVEMFMNNGKYKGKQILKPESIKQMTTPQWNYSWKAPNGDTYDGSLNSYGLGLMHFVAGTTSRPTAKGKTSLWGHTGEAYGFIGGIMWQPGTKNGFVFMQNGYAGSYNNNEGNYSGHYAWEENFMTAVMNNAF